MKGVRFLARALPISVGVLLLAALSVFGWVQVGRTVEAAGEVKVHRYEVVRPRVQGIVSTVRAESGEFVQAGQVLFELLDFDFERERIDVRKRFQDAKAQKLALDRRLRRLNDEIHPLEEEQSLQTVLGARLEEESSDSRIRELKIQLDRAKETTNRMEKLHEAGLLSAQALAEYEFDELQAEERYQQSLVGGKVAEQEITGSQNDLDLLQAEQRSALAEIEIEASLLDSTIQQLDADLARLEEISEHYLLRAEIDGLFVGEPAGDLRGRSVQAGEDLATVIDVESVHFVTYVPEQAILKVRAGQEAKIELTGLPKRTFDVFAGEVMKVAEEPQLFQTDSSITYPVEIRLGRPWVMWEGNRFYVRSGMQGRAEIAYRDDVSVLRAIYESIAGEPGAENARGIETSILESASSNKN